MLRIIMSNCPEHLAACDSGTVVHDVGGRGLYDRETFVSFKSAFYEA